MLIYIYYLDKNYEKDKEKRLNSFHKVSLKYIVIKFSK